MTTPELVVLNAGLSEAASTSALAGRLAQATIDAASITLKPRQINLREYANDALHALLSGVPSVELETQFGAVGDAAAIIVATPVYNASFSPLLKLFVDIAPERLWKGKPLLLAATGASARHSLMIDHALRPLFAYLHAATVPTGIFAATSDWGGDSAKALESEVAPLRSRISSAGAALAAAISAPIDHRTAEEKPVSDSLAFDSTDFADFASLQARFQAR